MDGERLGDRNSLLQEIHAITGISVQALKGSPLSRFSVDERLSWAEGRETKREEDTVYSLLGLFDIHLPLIYGEGRKKALIRLHKEIKESSSLRLSTELSEHILGSFSSRPSGEDLKSSDVPSLPSAYMEVLERLGSYKDLKVAPPHTVSDLMDTINTLSKLFSSINPASHSWQQPTQLKGHLKGRISFL